MVSLLLVVAMFAVPLVAGVLLGLIQLGAYRLLGRPADEVPSFPILFARGLLLVFAIAAILAIALRAGHG